MVECHDFLVELGTEELPPKTLRTLETALATAISEGLTACELSFQSVKSFATPRRLAVCVQKLAALQPDRWVERRGPAVAAAFKPDGQATPAAEGFARTCGVTVGELDRLRTDKGEWLFYKQLQKGGAVADVLPSIVEVALKALPIPRPMRWSDKEEAFIRPAHWLVMLYGETVIPCTLLGLTADRITRGHRFHAPDPIALSQPADYERALMGVNVVADSRRRRQRIETLISEVAAQYDAAPVLDDALLEEVTALVEWPVAVVAQFDKRFLELPAEMIIATLQGHQRYFPLRDRAGKLLAQFITISNVQSRDPNQVRAGNERVVRPRLTDAEFFYRQDLKRPLSERALRLQDVTFEKRLGTVAERCARIASLAEVIAGQIAAGSADVVQAARLAKADLLSGVVGEFPELQGIMGSYYALAQGESAAVATAIREHYLPRHAGDALPVTPAGQVLALADKLDALAGIFAVGERPTGEKDPYGLRRAAIGLLRILIEGELDLDLREVVAQAVSLQPVPTSNETTEAVFDFVMERLRAYCQDAAIRHDSFAAVLAVHPRSPVDFMRRLQAVERFRSLPESDALSAANKRIHNILRRTGEANKLPTLRGESLEAAAEQALFQRLSELKPQVEAALARRDYQEALLTLAGLRETVDRFFEEVLVMAEDAEVRLNRLALLATIQALFLNVADISCLQNN